MTTLITRTASNTGKLIVNQPCEICGNEHSQAEMSLRYPQYGYEGDFELRRCSGCSLVFNSPRLDPQALEQLYDRNYYIFAEPVQAAFERVAGLYQATVARLDALAPAGAPMLEVGSAKGYMQALLADRGRAVQGVELSSHASTFAKRRFGVDTFTGPLDSWLRDPAFRPLPFAYSNDVIEHVPSPRKFVAALYQAVEPNGHVLIGTPNIASDGVAAYGDDWLGFNPFHIWLFSRETLSKLLRRGGFSIEEAWTFGNSELGRYPPQSPARRWLRNTASRTGLLPLLRRLRGSPPEASDTDIAAWRSAVGVRLGQARPWADSDDGCHARATTCRGDNLVILARRLA